MLARSLMDAGVVRERHVPQRFSGNHLVVCQSALTDWLNSRLGGLRCLLPKFLMSVGTHELDESFGRPVRVAEGAVVEWYCAGGVFPVGPALERLEALWPRLGRTVLFGIQEAAWGSAPLFTPQMVMEAASETYWYGESDELQAIEMNCVTEEDRKDMAENMVTKKLIESAYPAWALGPDKRKRAIGVRTLRHLAGELKGGWERSIVEDVLDLIAIKQPKRDWGYRDGHFLGFAGVLTWGRTDAVSLRVVDDYQQMIGESGDYFEDCGRSFIPTSEAGAMAAWFKEVESWCRAVELIDRLIHRLLD